MTNTVWIVWTDERKGIHLEIGDMHTRFDCPADAVRIGNALIDGARGGTGKTWIDIGGRRMTFRSPEEAAKLGAALVKGSGQR